MEWGRGWEKGVLTLDAVVKDAPDVKGHDGDGCRHAPEEAP